MKHLEEDSAAEMAVFKKKLKKIDAFKGSGTQLISLYVPENADRSSVMNQLNEEISQSSNIKSPQTRKNVQGALRKIIQFLKNIDFKIPKRGLVVFSGNISETEGRTDIKLFTVNPVKDLRTKLYWCDSNFHLAPLKEMLAPSEIYGLITMDKREATIAVLLGKRYEILGHFTSMVAGKTRAGGQCLDSNTLIMQPNGNIIEIGKTHNPLPVCSADFNNWQTTESIIMDKWETEKKPLTIITKYPRFEITSSKDHTFFVFEKGNILEKKASELKLKDQLIFPEKINTPLAAPQELNTQHFNSYSISPEGRKTISQARKQKKLHQKSLAKILGITQTAISSIEIGKRNIRHHLLVQYLKALDFNPEEFINSQCKPIQEYKIPSLLNKELAQIIGYWLGDGNTEKERVCFSEQRKNVAEYYSNLIKEIFNTKTSLRKRESKGYYEIRAYGKPIVKFLQSEFPEKRTALNSEIPEKILCSPNSVLSGFLKGFFDAEVYASSRGIGLGINNKKLAQQLQLVLLRFGIISSLTAYDNRKNPYSKNERYTIQISEKKSYELFLQNIEFTDKEKNQKIKKLIEKSEGKSRTRQVIATGQQIRKIIESNGWKKQKFISAGMFLQGKRKIGKEAFEKSILEKSKENQSLYQMLKKVMEKELLPAEISQIKKSENEIPMTDIHVQNQNFIGGGLIVHNSSVRFERLREEAAQDFYKKISERLNEVLLPYGEKLKGLVVAGPGMTKQFFLEKDLIDHRIKDKIIGTVDLSYTDESGIRELVDKAEDLLKDTELGKERTALKAFFTELGKGELAEYGEKQVLEALEQGKIKTLFLSEGINWIVYKIHCEKTNSNEEFIVRDPVNFKEKEITCKDGSKSFEIIEDIDYLDFLIEKAQLMGTDVKVVSTDSEEGQQFFKVFGGIGAILRYK